MPLLDKEIARIRNTFGEEPEAARQRVAELLTTTRSSSSRKRLWGLMIPVCRRMDDLDGGLRAYHEGRRLRGSALATAELEWQGAELHVVRADLEAARRAVEIAIGLAQPLATRARKGRGVYVNWPRTTYAATLITRAHVRMFLEHDPHAALPDAMEALRWADPRYAAQVHLSAVSVVALLIAQPGVGRPEDLKDALRRVDQAQRLLRKRRVPARHPHRIRLRGIRALALARLGAGELAERILARAIEELREQGLARDAEIAAEQLLWVVAERCGKAGRARLLRRQLGLPAAPEAPVAPDRGDPIGF